MPELMHSSPMREENEDQHENRHEKIILSDHDALLLLFPLPRTEWHLKLQEDVTEGTLVRDRDHKPTGGCVKTKKLSFRANRGISLFIA